MEFANLKETLQNAVEKAEGIGIEEIRKGNSFYPYIFSQNNKIKRIINNQLDEAIEIAEEEIERMEEETVVLVLNDEVSLKDGTFDAIISHIYNEDEDYAYSFALPYKIEDGSLKFMNKRVFLGNIRNCLIY